MKKMRTGLSIVALALCTGILFGCARHKAAAPLPQTLETTEATLPAETTTPATQSVPEPTLPTGQAAVEATDGDMPVISTQQWGNLRVDVNACSRDFLFLTIAREESGQPEHIRITKAELLTSTPSPSGCTNLTTPDILFPMYEPQRVSLDFIPALQPGEYVLRLYMEGEDGAALSGSFCTIPLTVG